MSEAQGKKATRGLWGGAIIEWVRHFLFITGGTPGVKTLVRSTNIGQGGSYVLDIGGGGDRGF